MNITVIGTGYVGLPTGVGLAMLGHDVVCMDQDVQKIRNLESGECNLSESGLEEGLERVVASHKLRFTTSMQEAVECAQIIIIAVGTPPVVGSCRANLTYIKSAARGIAKYIGESYVTIAVKSTVPVGTGELIENIIRTKAPKADMDVISLPEFLREGRALHDFFHPDRIIVGTRSTRARNNIKRLYSTLEHAASRIVFCERRAAELVKYASNAFLAVKIHYINEMADLCEKLGINVQEISLGMGLDSRIGSAFLNAGPGFGGSCFPKDTMALQHTGRTAGVTLSLVEGVIKRNKTRLSAMALRILDSVAGIPNPKIAVLGLAFKKGTDDVRESPAIHIIQELIKHNVSVHAYDPCAIQNAQKILGKQVTYFKDVYESITAVDALVILTEWSEFESLDLSKCSALMSHKIILDFRNILNPQNATESGFRYYGVGRGNL